MSITSMVAIPSASVAELSSDATISWGVSGLATGTLTDSIRSQVWAITQIENRIFVGGRFTATTNGSESVDQPFLAAFDSNTGDYIPTFTPQLDNAVYALHAAPDGSKLFVAGSFQTVNGVATGGLVALDPTTGSIDPWTGGIGGYNLVRNLDLVGPYLYVSGGFTSIDSSTGSSQAWGAARFDWQSGVHDGSWRPVVSGGSVWGIAASKDLDRVYLAGVFNQVNGEATSGGFQAVTASTGDNVAGVQEFQINTQNISRQWLYDVVVTNGFVFAGGSEHFVQVLNESDLSLHKFHISEPNRGDYQDLEVVGDRVYAGCHCTSDQVMNSADGVRWFGSIPPGETNALITASQPNAWAFAIDANTGLAIESFVPNINSSGPGVWAIHGSTDGCVWFGGSITRANGVDQYGLTRLCEGPPPGSDTERPSTPGSPQVQSVGSDWVDLVWNPSTDNVGVEGYRILDSVDGSVLIDVGTNGGTVAGLGLGTYAVYAKAYDAAGNESWRSGTTRFTIGGNADTERPSTPTGLRLVGVNDGLVELVWNPSTDNVGVTGYFLYDSATAEVVADVPQALASLNLPAGTYTLYVKAYDDAGNLSWRSNLLSVDV